MYYLPSLSRENSLLQLHTVPVIYQETDELLLVRHSPEFLKWFHEIEEEILTFTKTSRYESNVLCKYFRPLP